MERFQQLATRNPDKYLPYSAEMLCVVAEFDLSQNRSAAARIHYQEALKIYRGLPTDVANRHTRQIASVEAALAKLGQTGVDK